MRRPTRPMGPFRPCLSRSVPARSLPWRGIFIATGLALAGCPGADATHGDPHPREDGDPPQRPPGLSCRSGRDCPAAQDCVAGVCHHAETSRAGEILAVGASNQMEAGDLKGALTSFEEARQAFERVEAPVPAPILCGAAVAALRLADDEATREEAAQAADRCFRGSLPGDPLRAEVQGRIAQLRFDGIDLKLFDQEEAAAMFFVEEPSRPTADAIQVSLDLPASTSTGFDALQEALLSEKARVEIRSCFVADWERSHDRSITADLVLRFRTRLRDMGDYDAYAAEVSVTEAEEGSQLFATCLSKGLTEALQPGPRVGRVVSAWQEAFLVQASVP